MARHLILFQICYHGMPNEHQEALLCWNSRLISEFVKDKLPNGYILDNSGVKVMNNFTDPERAAVYKAIMLRRDIRQQFEPTPIQQGVLSRILSAAHHAGSVGFMQPWDFILIENRDTRQKVLDGFLRERDRCADFYDGPRKELFLSLKLEGILESALNICITCDRTRGGPHVLGRSTIIETDLYSTCCAVQNLWLAARAEGIGVGWVSILDPQQLSAILGLPDHVLPVAYLCAGYVREFPDRPELQRAGWRNRMPLSDLVHLDRWDQGVDEAWSHALTGL